MKTFTRILSLSILLTVVFTIFSVAQNSNWLNFTNGDYVTDIAGEGNVLWIATSGGLVHHDKLSGQSTYYNKANSGLPSNDISAIDLETSGKIWIVTSEGLTSFDGNNWQTFTVVNSGLPSNLLNDLAVDQNNDKWITSYAGLIFYDGNSWTVYDTSNSQISTQFLSRIFISPAGEKWITSSPGLQRFDGTNWILYDYTVAPFPLYNTTSIAFKNNEVWIATHGDFSQGEGAIVFDGVNWIDYTPANSGLPYFRVECIDIDTAGNVWLGNFDSFGSGFALVKYDGLNWTPNGTGATTNSPAYFNQLFIDSDDRIFTARIDNGAFEFIMTSFNKIPTSNSGITRFGGDEISIDPQNNYLFTNYLGYTEFDGQQWIKYDTLNSAFLGNGVYDISRDYSGNTWIATQTGLIKHDGTSWTRFDNSNSGLTDNFVNKVIIDPDNNIWLGTNSAPFKFDGVSTWTNYFPNGGSHIEDLFVSRNGYVWMGSPGYGLTSFDRINTWQNYQPGMGAYRSGIAENGNVWFGTSIGLAKWDGINWTFYNTTNGLPDNAITALRIDSNDILWIGTQNGLSKFDGTTFTNYLTTNSPLTHNYISDIEIDGNNNKWIGTGNGVSVFNESGVVLGIHENGTSNQNSLLLYPNPAGESFKIRLKGSGNIENDVLLISDITGKEIMSLKLLSEVTVVDVSSFSPGIYFAKVFSKDVNYCTKLIRQ
jgi:ligand-binding sensor domain-containing protein